MRLEIQNFLRHQCFGGGVCEHFISLLFIFSILYLLASFHPFIHLLPLAERRRIWI